MAGLYTLPPGVDFGAEVLRGLIQRYDNLGDAVIYVNTRRLQRRLVELLITGEPRVMPRIKLVTDLMSDPVVNDMPPAVAPLRRKLELSALVRRLVEAEQDLGRSAIYAITDSLAALINEMHDEGVDPSALNALDVEDESGHWQRAQNFLNIALEYSKSASSGPDEAARARQAVVSQIAHWEAAPPTHPVILAGSTASRGTTFLLAQAIAKLPQGSVIFPGFDDMPATIWDSLNDPMTGEDHPQYRAAKLAKALGVSPVDLRGWTDTPPPSIDRNRLVSLALRPAPVTDGWLQDGPNLQGLPSATQGITLVEAPSPRIEAEAIALRLRQSASDGTTVALISPDRVLTRMVTSALDRWGITPDDSAGLPLHLSPPGRLLRSIAGFLAKPADAQGLLILLKHPLAHSGNDRGEHLRWTRELELHLRRYGPPFPTAQTLFDWSSKNEGSERWANWVADLLSFDFGTTCHLTDHVARHTEFGQLLASGGFEGSGALWDAGAGRAAWEVMTDLAAQADAGEDLYPSDYVALIDNLLQSQEVHDRDAGHPHVLIWGTLEARVQSAPMVILAGLNDGVWPSAPSADPWLNRRMRTQAGLLLPDRQVGLSAHDFQMAIAAPEVWLTRSLRSEETETVPSRWVNRLTNLLDGLAAGKPCLDQMRERGARWIALAEALDRPSAPVPPSLRPSPRPPVDARPKALRITDIAKLGRDPYEIYAREILRLKRLDPLYMQADARDKGIAIHEIMERFAKDFGTNEVDPRQSLLGHTETVLNEKCHWPISRNLWRAQMERNASAIVSAEVARRDGADLYGAEISADIDVAGITLRGRADRIDVTYDGRAIVYDYKTGTPPSVNAQKALDKQLLVEAAMIEQGAFADLGRRSVVRAEYLQIGAQVKSVAAPLADCPPDQTWADLIAALTKWHDRFRGYTARMAAQTTQFDGDYDHLSRYGEWDASQEPKPEDVG